MTRPWSPPPYTGEPRHVLIPHRRAQILTGLCRGLPNTRIGADLYITEDTVKTHIRRILATIGASNRTEVVWLILTGRVVIWVPEP